MSNLLFKLAGGAAVVVASASAWSQTADFNTFGATASQWFTPYAISANGALVVGESWRFDAPFGLDWRAASWSAGAGINDLGTRSPSRTASTARAVNADGTVIAGSSSGPGLIAEAFRWTRETGPVSLGVLNGGTYSSATAISADGRVVVGYGSDGAAPFGEQRAFRWTQAGGMVSLGALNGGFTSVATAVNADGTVVVGDAHDGQATIGGSTTRAFRWTPSGGMASLGSLSGLSSFASAVSADGSVIVGSLEKPDTRTGRHLSSGPISNRLAFRWTEDAGIESLVNLPGLPNSVASAVSADGKVIVGTVGGESPSDDYHAFRWTRGAGMQSVVQWLAENGVRVGSPSQTRAFGTNADGSIVVGSWGDRLGFIARVSPIGTGLITLADVEQSLATGATAGAMLLSTLGTVLNGAHSRPLARRVAPDKNAFWMAGDAARDEHGARDGNIGLAEVGLGRNFGLAQINVSVGQSRARQDLALSGRAKTDGTYVLTQALIPVYQSVTATLGVYGGWGESEVRRGYLNGGAADFSSGSPDTTMFGFRARVDWENAVSLAGASLTPYVDVTRSRTHLDGYTESGGGFPARFDARRETATELRLGTGATRELSNNIQLVGMLEAAHRFEKSGARTTGNLIGLFGFDLPGARYDRDWLRIGGGIEARVAGGTASLMLNATTRGSAPSYWASLSWQLAF